VVRRLPLPHHPLYSCATPPSPRIQHRLITTDLTTPATAIIARYAARWSIEVAIEDAKQITGVGEPETAPARRATHRPVRLTHKPSS